MLDSFKIINSFKLENYGIKNNLNEIESDFNIPDLNKFIFRNFDFENCEDKTQDFFDFLAKKNQSIKINIIGGNGIGKSRIARNICYIAKYNFEYNFDLKNIVFSNDDLLNLLSFIDKNDNLKVKNIKNTIYIRDEIMISLGEGSYSTLERLKNIINSIRKNRVSFIMINPFNTLMQEIDIDLIINPIFSNKHFDFCLIKYINNNEFDLLRIPNFRNEITESLYLKYELMKDKYINLQLKQQKTINILDKTVTEILNSKEFKLITDSKEVKIFLTYYLMNKKINLSIGEFDKIKEYLQYEITYNRIQNIEKNENIQKKLI